MISFSEWEMLSDHIKTSLLFCRLVRDAAARELNDELEGYFDEAEAEKLIFEIICNQHSSSLNKVLDKFSGRRQFFEPESHYEKLAKFLFTLSKHVADLEREQVRQPILIPA